MRKIIQKILKILAKAVLNRYQPTIIAITGSVGKTSAKEAIFAVLKSQFNVRKNLENFNNEIGVPITILGIEDAIGRNIFKWISGILKSIKLILIKSKNYPKILILEMGADKPGDISYFNSFIDPAIGLVTACGEIPVHIEFFDGPHAVAEEKSKLVKALRIDDFAVLNYDDKIVLEMKEKVKSRVLTFGFQEGADIRAVNYEIKTKKSEELESEESWVPEGVNFKIEYKGSFVPVRLSGAFGKQQIYAALAGAACGIILGLNLIEISQALLEIDFPKNRMKLISGIKNSFIIDDTYNSSPLSMIAALESMEDIKAKRKIAVLGDMKELGRYTEQAHRIIGKKAARIVDLLFVVGLKAKFIQDEAIQEGFNQEKIFEFSDSEEAGRKLQEIVESGDLILIKGSRSMKMELAVEEIRADFSS